MAERAESELKIFGQRLRNIRKEKKLSIEKLANMAELELVQINRIELGKTNPKLSTIYALAKALDVSIGTIFSYDDFLEKASHIDTGGFTGIDWQSEIKSGFYADLYKETSPGIYVLDYTKRKYLFVDEKMAQLAGQSVNELMQDGLDLALELWHPADLKIYDKNILPKNISFLKTILPAESNQYLFTCNYRVKHASGKYIKIEQQSYYANFTKDGTPLLTIGFIRDITDRTTSNDILHTIDYITSKASERKFEELHPIGD